ncbi:MAG: winged helix-turn-helix domain-containing protein [Pseudomonadota bacterium]
MRLVLNPKTDTVTINGRTIRLRPKTHAVLEYFMNNPNQLLSKSTIIKAIWTDSIVTDDSLTQCIAELRRALDDDAKTLIETVPRRGFIFHYDQPTPSGSDDTDVRVLPRIVIGVVILLIGSGLLFFALPSSVIESDRVQEYIAVANINTQGDQAFSSAQLLSEAIRLKLEDVSTLSVRSIRDWRPTQHVAQELSAVRSQGVDWLISGDIMTLEGGGSQRVNLWLWNVSSSARYSLGVFAIPVASDSAATTEFVKLRDRIVERALQRLPGHTVRSTRTNFPSTLRDFEVYAQVMVELEKERCDPKLAEMMQPVVADAPQFARGWMALAWTHWVEFWACGTDTQSLSEAVAAADQVLKYRPNDPLAIKVKTSSLAAMGDVSGALQIADSAANASPQEAALWSTVSYLLNYTGDLQRSESAMNRALALDPLVLVSETGETPNVYLYVNQWQRYIDTQPPFDAPFFNFQRAYALYRLGDKAQSADILRDTRQRFPSDLYSRFCSVLLAIIEDENVVAQNILIGIIEERDASGQSDGEVAYREAVLLMLAGRPRLAIERLYKATSQGFLCLECVQRDPIWETTLASTALQEWIKTNH